MQYTSGRLRNIACFPCTLSILTCSLEFLLLEDYRTSGSMRAFVYMQECRAIKWKMKFTRGLYTGLAEKIAKASVLDSLQYFGIGYLAVTSDLK